MIAHGIETLLAEVVDYPREVQIIEEYTGVVAPMLFEISLIYELNYIRNQRHT